MEVSRTFKSTAHETASHLVMLTPDELAAPAIFRVSSHSSAQLLAGVVNAESVHHFDGDHTGTDMRVRLGGIPDTVERRAIFAWRDPTDMHGALISVQTAFTSGMPDNIQDVLNAHDVVVGKPETATFYSISNWGRARGVGELFLDAVVKHIRHELDCIVNFCTLSPMPSFRNWVSQVSPDVLETVGIEIPSLVFKASVQHARNTRELEECGVFDGIKSLAAFHILGGNRSPDGKLKPFDRIVAGFHQGRGAVAERLCIDADQSVKGFEQSFGLMVNYLNIGDKVPNAAAYRRGEPVLRPAITAWLPPVEPRQLHQTLWSVQPTNG